VMTRIRSSAERARIRDELIESRPESYWSTVIVGSTTHPDNMQFRGAPLIEVARILDMAPVDALLCLIERDELQTGAFFRGMNEGNMCRILAEPYVMIGSDASLRAPQGPLSEDYPHPRAYGSFVRFLRMALDQGLVSLPEAIRKMTSLPADHFRLIDRGRIAPGLRADLMAFDPATVRETTSYAAPHKLAEGIEHLFVNGAHTLKQGSLTGQRAGRVLI
jgi:N-acyl-D-amino-acid deacylase